MLRQWEQGPDADPQSRIWPVGAGGPSQIGDGPANGASAPIGQRDHDEGWPPYGVHGHELELLSAQGMMGIDDRHMRDGPINNRGLLPCPCWPGCAVMS
jgi:hypothetical protein